LTVWRIDSDQNALVIWIQPVYFFTGCNDAVTGAGSASSRAGSDETLAVSPRIRFALRCPTTTEGYYVTQSLDGRRLTYSTVNIDGDALPGAWLFGQTDEPEEESTRSILGINGLFKGPGDQQYLAYYQTVRR
jgi:hypothetical protein